MGFTHFDENSNAVMVDVGHKPTTRRRAEARGRIQLNAEIMEQIAGRTNQKGDVLGVARLAGIMAVKQTAHLIPLCHPIPIVKCGIDFEPDYENQSVEARCSVVSEGQTGVEMEALTGVSIALLTIYDMCKALDKKMCLTDIHLLSKSGGSSGDFFHA